MKERNADVCKRKIGERTGNEMAAVITINKFVWEEIVALLNYECGKMCVIKSKNNGCILRAFHVAMCECVIESVIKK